MLKQHTGQVEFADSLSAEQKSSFRGGCQAVILPVGFTLWRFVSKQRERRFGSFWLDKETMDIIMRSLHDNGNFSQKRIKDNIRDSLAILEKWSDVNWRQQIRTSKEVIAYVGQTGSQKQFTVRSNDLPFGGAAEIQQVIETRIGSQKQYVIPRFKKLSNINEWARLGHFAHV